MGQEEQVRQSREEEEEKRASRQEGAEDMEPTDEGQDAVRGGTTGTAGWNQTTNKRY